ncbi:DUF7455 domain-containing protein [Streptomyces canus]|uniref:DUF7455 domain-containing protein n=1 Tax=Streptomyces canus TaxID=58343 RepID=UPI0040388CB7
MDGSAEKPDITYPPLTRTDRCDALGCPAAASVRFFNAVSDLVYCSHHCNTYEAGMVSAGFLYYEDSRDWL